MEKYLRHDEISLVDKDIGAGDADFGQAAKHFQSVVVCATADYHNLEFLAFVKQLSQDAQQQGRAEITSQWIFSKSCLST